MEFLFLIIFCILIVVWAIAKTYSYNEKQQRKVGRDGEKLAAALIKSVLHYDDRLFTNVTFEYKNQPVELDCVVVNKYGVFIIEVKNYTGEITGNENDYEWKKCKKTYAGNIYEKNVKNPIKQVKRQVYLLAKYLKCYNIDVWVKGYALLLQGNSPVNNEYILSSLDEIDKAIHTKNRTLLSVNTVNKIKNLIS